MSETPTPPAPEYPAEASWSPGLNENQLPLADVLKLNDEDLSGPNFAPAVLAARAWGDRVRTERQIVPTYAVSQPFKASVGALLGTEPWNWAEDAEPAPVADTGASGAVSEPAALAPPEPAGSLPKEAAPTSSNSARVNCPHCGSPLLLVDLL